MPARVGPGPGAYMLPPTVGYEHHDVSRYRNPQYSIGQKLPTQMRNIGPGPKYELSKVTKYGKVSPPAYSMAFRHKDLTAFKPPGPGTYSPEKAPRMREPRPPAYSISSRYAPFKPFVTPGPNQYPVPSTLGPKVPNLPSSAAYTMAGKHGLKSMDCSPGPARYGETGPNIYKYKSPNFSMGIRHKDLCKGSGSPGPAGYLPKLPGCPCAAGYSFGHRTSNDPYITAQDNMPCVRKHK